MANAFQDRIGVTAEERVTNAFNTGSNVSTRNIGMLVERERGVDGKPVLINSLKEDKRIFGNHNSNMYSSYVVENLFANTGGYNANLYQLRIVGQGSEAAHITVSDGAENSQTLTTKTYQDAQVGQEQVEHVKASNVEEGDTFTLTIDLMDNGSANSETVSHVATTTDINDVLVALRAGLTNFFGGLADTFTASVTGGETLVITSPENSPFTVITSTINESGSSTNIFDVYAGRMGGQDKGTWGNDLKVKVFPIDHVNGSPDGYRMEIYYKLYLMEYFISNGTDWQSLVDAVNQRSEFVMIDPTTLGTPLVTAPFESNLIGGAYVAPVDMDFEPSYNAITQEPEGMAIFEGVDVQILACPEVFTPNYMMLCNAFAEKHRKFFVFNLPYLATESVIETYYNSLFDPNQSFSAGYLNWAEVPADNSGNKIWIPAIGYVLGAGYVRKAGLFNGYVWTPPAGVETNSKGVFNFTHGTLSEQTLSRYVKKWRTNVIKFIKNTGFCIWSSRTYSNNALFESIHVRLETNWLLQSIVDRNERFMQRIYSPTLQKEMRLDNLIWFKNVYEKGGIERTVPFEEAVIVDVSVQRENRKEAEIEISWIPPECLEHIHIKLNRNDGVMILNF